VKKIIKFIINYILRSHSKLELLKFPKPIFVSYYLTSRCLLKVMEALASMAVSDSREELKLQAFERAYIMRCRNLFLMVNFG
jgi:hypothetical protein